MIYSLKDYTGHFGQINENIYLEALNQIIVNNLDLYPPY